MGLENGEIKPYWCCVLGKAAYCLEDCGKCAEVNKEFWKEYYGESETEYVEIKEDKGNN